MLFVQALQYVFSYTATLIPKALHKVFFKTTYYNACSESIVKSGFENTYCNAFYTSVAVLCVSREQISPGKKNPKISYYTI